ncbi:hypothetical protein KVP09_01900 [Alcaligenaceae bacterium CGII-47]|nr:hypothetical protein [Alcaligenaceae bacterium CGII-47]
MKTHRQAGQAVIEGLVVLGVLSSLWVGATWIGRLQDAALQAGHASRHQAFALAHQAQPLDASLDGNLPGQFWQARRGGALLDAQATQSSVMQDKREPSIGLGGTVPAALAARQDLQLGESGVWIVTAHRRTMGEVSPGSGLQNFDQLRLGIDRHTAIMRGTGAAVSDSAAQARIAQADSVWARQAGRSIALGDHVSGRMQAVDAAWGRAAFTPDWLMPWTGWVPTQHLSAGGIP